MDQEHWQTEAAATLQYRSSFLGNSNTEVNRPNSPTQTNSCSGRSRFHQTVALTRKEPSPLSCFSNDSKKMALMLINSLTPPPSPKITETHVDCNKLSLEGIREISSTHIASTTPQKGQSPRYGGTQRTRRRNGKDQRKLDRIQRLAREIQLRRGGRPRPEYQADHGGEGKLQNMVPLPCLARSSVFFPFRGLSGVGQREGAFGNLLFPLQGRLYLRLLLLTKVPNSVLYLQIPVSSLSMKFQMLLSVSLVF
jgi:hypothetical protein